MAVLSVGAIFGLLIPGGPAQAQVYDSTERSPDAFTWVQPLNTTILGQYGHSEPVYPSPRTTGAGYWGSAYERARAFVAELTLLEKADMVTGVAGPCIGNIYPIPRLNFSGICLQDGPVSLRVADYVSVFPSGVTVAASWDKRIMYERNLAMGREFRAKGAHVALAIYGGRNWEGFSPDPYLSGVAMELSVRGIQDAGVQAVAKHLLANEQEILRNPVYYPNGTLQFEAISSNVDDRTLHELYLWPFANAVHAGVASNGILKKELGFQGYVMSDWFGLHAGIDAIEAGMDMDMPGRLRSSTPDAENDFPTVDASSVFLNWFSNQSTWLRELDYALPHLQDPTNASIRDAHDNHAALIRKHAAESTVLLKNTDNALPLLAPRYIGIFGNDAGETQNGLMNHFGNAESWMYGTCVVGGGSGTGRLSYVTTPQEALKTRAIQDGTLVETWLNNTLIATSDVTSLWSYRGPDVCLVFLKSWARETIDRESLHLDWDGDQVVESVASRCNNTIVITHSAGANVLPFADHPNVTAILLAHYPGQETGNSITDVLYGDVNPSGKLPYTIAYNESDYSAPIVTNIQTTGAEDWQAWFDEALEIDYRYFDAHNIPVRYEFGYGLSYTTFDMSNIEIEPASSLPITPFSSSPSLLEESLVSPPGGHPGLWQTLYTVRVSVTNTGPVRGSAVPQLYITFPGAEGSSSGSEDSALSGTPPRQLRGFEKIELAPGEQRSVAFGVMRRDISYWDVVAQQWAVPEGEFVLRLGLDLGLVRWGGWCLSWSRIGIEVGIQ
ncbi:glycoside hydrolase superfamily [Aspergillus insuetus]